MTVRVWERHIPTGGAPDVPDVLGVACETHGFLLNPGPLTLGGGVKALSTLVRKQLVNGVTHNAKNLWGLAALPFSRG
jgi:hypothetical protein